MDIKKKLEFYKTSTAKPNPDPDFPSSLKALAEHLDAEIVYPQAPVLKISRSYQIPESLQSCLQDVGMHSLKFLSKNSVCTKLDLNRCLFFDLETTGLMGGSGTFPFLIGFGKFKEGQYIVDQFFLPEFGREYYLYKDIQIMNDEFDNLISYNGKSYDWPLLKSRFIMNHIQSGLGQLQHHDLLHYARRIWKDSYNSCDLISIENHVLNRNRVGDIPGWLIPQAYFDFLNFGKIHDIVRIIEHNYLDIISLAELLLVLFRINTEPSGLTDQKSLLRLASLAFDLNEEEIFNAIFNTCKASDSCHLNQIKTWKSLLHKKNLQWNQAILIWEELLNTEAHAFFAFEELAKYYEHQEREFEKALEYSERALLKIGILKELNSYNQTTQEMEQLFLYRRNRLKSKIA